MSLKITVDEDLPRQAVQLLQEHGYDAASVIEQGMGGWKDSQLWIAVQKDERYLVTLIKDLVIFVHIHQGHIMVFCFYALMKTAFDRCWNY